MAVLEVHNASFGYGADRLFSGVTFSLEAGERAAVVAPNGAGKSTLLRVVEGALEPDEGAVVRSRNVVVAAARQSHEVTARGSVLDAFLAGFGDLLALRNALAAAQEGAAAGTPEALARLSHLTDRYHHEGGDAVERKIAIIAERLGFGERDLARPVASLSGGERGRLHLGVALASDADLLLLDEPTNHLDIETIEWLERHLVGLRAAVLVVSHDRAFLDNVSTRTMELGRRTFRDYPLPYSRYVEAREEDLARERKLKEERDAFVAKTEDFIRKNIAGQKTKQAQSRRRMLSKLDEIEAPEDVWAVAEKVAFRFADAPRTGDIVLDVRGARAERGGRTLFEGVDLLLRRGERVGVVGPNGAGKSTFLKLLAGLGAAGDTADVRRGTNLREGYFDQHLGEIDETRSAVEEIRSVRGDLTVDAARQYLARFRFWGDAPLRKTRGFSGGEKSRLALAKLLLEPKNLLFLDEPTNHLDIPAAEILEEALTGFAGTVVLVSHDRRFLERVTTRIVSIADGVAEVYSGGYRDVARELAARRAPQPTRPSKAPKPVDARRVAQPTRPVAPPKPVALAEAPRADAASGSRRTVKTRRSSREDGRRRRAEALRAHLDVAEARLGALRAELRDHPGGDFAHLAKLATEEQALSKRVAEDAAEWTRLVRELGEGEAHRRDDGGGGVPT
jgi:ATP-binding cassette subfamily F protein 3